MRPAAVSSRRQIFSLRKAALLLAGIGIAQSLGSTTACHPSGRRAQPSVDEAGAPSSAEPPPNPLTEALAEQLCAIYADWPVNLPLAESSALDHPTPDGSPDSDVPSALAVAGRAAERCPDVIARASVTERGLPYPALGTTPLPIGAFGAATAATPDELRSRYEWTAIGFGCAAVRVDDEADLDGFETRFLRVMGLTTASYVEASLDLADPTASQRIFAGIQRCAERASELRQ